MARYYVGKNVLTAAIERVRQVYEDGHRVVVAFSGGKDSTAILEVTILAAKQLGINEVEVQFIDEEIVYPGTQEYVERTANRKGIKFHWVVLNHPNINVCNRENPYWYAYDPWLEKEKWMQIPPDNHETMDEIDLYNVTNINRFPSPPGKDLMSIVGIRTSESGKRYLVLAGMHGRYITTYRGNPKPILRKNADGTVNGARNVWPIYDWTVGDLWKAVKELKWDYDKAYDTMARMGVAVKLQRIAPVGFNESSNRLLKMMQGAWPDWVDKVCERLPGTRAALNFGVRAVQPQRRLGETWESCFKRTCIETAPAWIAERSTTVMNAILEATSRYSNRPFPDVGATETGGSSGSGLITSWKRMAMIMYCGDPFSLFIKSMCKEMEPEYFQKGRGTWADKGITMRAFNPDDLDKIEDEEGEG